MDHGIFIAVEHYQDSRISAVKYAEADATGLKAALEAHGLEQDKGRVLLSAKATKTSIESAVRTVCRSLHSDDRLFFFYAGHGFSDGMHNYITCHDTVYDDMVATSVQLQSLLREVSQSKCKRIVLMLDSCHSGLEIDDSMRSVLSDMTDVEFKAFCDASEHHLAFASCKTDEVSYSTGRVQHGIWSYHLIQAFEGTDKKALDRKKFLTATSLQNFLAQEVPRSVRTMLTGAKVQTPIAWGNMSREVLLADFTDIHAREAAARRTGLGSFSSVSLLGGILGAISKLSGFHKRGHRVPDSINEMSRGFVQRIGATEVTEEAQRIYADLKREFKYKRADIVLDDDQGGSARITTPDFAANITIDIDPDDASKYELRTEVSDIRNPHAIDSAEFATVFDDCFDRVVFEFSGKLPVETLIDKLEECGDARGIELDYPSSAKECSVTVPGFPTRLHFSSRTVTLAFKRQTSVENLLSALKSFPELTTSTGITELLPFRRE